MLNVQTVACTTALEVNLLAALVHERRLRHDLEAELAGRKRPKPTNGTVWREYSPHAQPLDPTDFIGPPEMYGPIRPTGPGWAPASAACIVDIQEAVAAQWGVTTIDMKGERRSPVMVEPRHVAILLCRTLTEWSYPRIGLHFGRRDHTTILHAALKMDWLRRELLDTLSFSEPLLVWVRRAQELVRERDVVEIPEFLSPRVAERGQIPMEA